MHRLTIDPQRDIQSYGADLDRFAAALKEGQLVAIPTETVYGLAADATSGIACARIFEAKGRPSFNPLISHVADLPTAKTHGVFGTLSSKLAEAFWPGPLTLVLPKKEGSTICDLATAGLDTVALRVPAAPVMRRLSELAGVPIAAPSANKSGRISTTSAQDVIDDLGSAIDHVIDAGPCPIGVESTIVAIVDNNAVLLRPGGISREEIERALGQELHLLQSTSNDEAPAAPGMLSSHYAPAAAVRLDAEEVRTGEALLSFGASTVRGAHEALQTINLSTTGSLREAAANLFKSMRQLDQSGAKTICVAPIPMEGIGEAINDRLRRAAAPRPD